MRNKKKYIYHLRLFTSRHRKKIYVFLNNQSQKGKKIYFFPPFVMPALPWLTRPQIFVTLPFKCHPNVNYMSKYKKNTYFMPTECTNQRNLSFSRYLEFSSGSWTEGHRWTAVTQPLQNHFLQVRKFIIYSTWMCVHVGGGAQQATVSVLLPWL